MRYLVGQDLKRNLRLWRALPLLGLGLLVGYNKISYVWQPPQQLQGFLTFNGHSLGRLLPLIAGVMGASLAEDRRRGFAAMVLAKGVPRSQYLLAKILGATVSSALITLLIVVGWFGITAALLPWGQWWMPHSGPHPALFFSSPLANDILAALFFMEASAALSLVSVLAGTLVTNEYIAIVSPALFVALCWVLGTESLELLQPLLYLEDLTDRYIYVMPSVIQPYAPIAYWLYFSANFAGLAHWVFMKRDLT